MNLPGHELVSETPLRDVPGQRRVFRTRVGDLACVTRVLLGARLPASLATLLPPMVLNGRGSLTGIPESVALTLEGYRVAARLPPMDPPRWPRAVAAGLTAEGHVYVTTTWMEGVPLDEAIRPLPHAPDLALDVLRVLDTLHRSHVAYGDLKPANLVLGDSGAALIDLDTLREVGGVHVPAVTRDLTRSWAAPEQTQSQHTYLASDLWAFAQLVDVLCGEELPPDWRAPLRACRHPDPSRRPRTDLLLAALEGQPVELVDALGRPLEAPPPAAAGGGTAGATERVEETHPGGPQGPGTERVAEDTTRGGTGPTLATAPTAPLARKLDATGCALWTGGLLLAGVLFCAGVGTWANSRVVADANRAAEDALQALKAYKTRAELNRDTGQRGALRELAQAAWEERHTARTTAVYALALVWEQGWQDAGRAWDEPTWTATVGQLAAAEASGEIEAQLAWGSLLAARCRLDPGPAAVSACDAALRALESFHAARGDVEATHWLAVEARWTALLVRNEVARSEQQARLPTADARFAEALAECDAAKPLLAWAPVNGPELVQACLHVAGFAGDVDGWLGWARWLVDADATDGSLSRTTVWHLYSAGGEGCDGVTTERSRGDWKVRKATPWCLALGHAGRGCLDSSREVADAAVREGDPHPWDKLYAALPTLPSACLR